MTQEYLKRILDYNPEDGLFHWKVNRAKNKVKAGDIAGSINSTGRLQICVDRKIYLASRLAWLYTYGSFPSNELDHKDCNHLNNRIDNLRQADHYQNGYNRKKIRLGLKGCYYHKVARKWVAQIAAQGKNNYLGLFTTEKDAHAEYIKHASILHGEFARAN